MMLGVALIIALLTIASFFIIRRRIATRILDECLKLSMEFMDTMHQEPPPPGKEEKDV